MYAMSLDTGLRLPNIVYIIGRLRGGAARGANLLGRRLVAAGQGGGGGIGGRIRRALGASGRLAQRVGRRLGR
ncbi:MAG: hypothetical protein KC496_03565 [Anaerolineae bacterium]|nr:hypothetical protein [Anaerolineae bacterium]